MKKSHLIKNVRVEVKKAISSYCKEKGIEQAYYLETDKRLAKYL